MLMTYRGGPFDGRVEEIPEWVTYAAVPVYGQPDVTYWVDRETNELILEGN